MHIDLGGLKVGLVGPLPPPSGGMANQCQQLLDLFGQHGLKMELVRTNRPYPFSWVENLRGLRALFRLVPYLYSLWKLAGRSSVVHVLANSGWAWHLYAAPAIWLAKLRGTPVIVNYRGGEADPFFSGAPRIVHRTLGLADSLVVPSGFLEKVFAKHGFTSRIVPNIINLDRFRARDPECLCNGSCHVVVTRNLEPIYGIPTVLEAFSRLKAALPTAKMTVAGSGPELVRLRALANDLGIIDSVDFCGRIDNKDIPELYASADMMVNPSTVDNMPISVLEAFASGVPVVSTSVGGVPFILRDGETGLLVSSGCVEEMAAAMIRIATDRGLARRLASAAADDVQRYSWAQVRDLWLAEYVRVAKAKPMELS